MAVNCIAIRDLSVVAVWWVLALCVPLELHHLEIELLGALVINPECVKPQSKKKGNDCKESSQGNDDPHKHRVTNNLSNGLFGVGESHE
ncbi:MAG: hypothetical protein ACMG6E_05680 [Candidatus Roizmanbacteria bacterium]